MKIVEITENDVYGKVFNGFEIAKSLNKEKGYNVKQLVKIKFSNERFVESFFKNQVGLDHEYVLSRLEHDILSVHSNLSITSYYLEKSKSYINADLAHYHQVHNANLNLYKLLEMAKNKPTVITFHDPWFLTGRCVHPGTCNKWKNGCKNCENLHNLFDFTEDHCHEMWNIKAKVLKESDPDIVVSSEYMLNLVKENPYTKDLNVHLLPFGLDLKKYDFKKSKNEVREELNIDKDKIVIFFREAKEKGTDYIVEALSKIENKENIVLLTCSQKGLLKEIESDFKIIELGLLEEKNIIDCYNASDIFLMPSLGESFGMMAVEAMASGLPVVIFDNTALPSVTNAPKIGVLAKNRDSEDLYQKIQMLIDDEDQRKKLGKLGKEFVAKEYALEKYEKSLKEIYEKSYERQKYKLNSKFVLNSDIDYEDKEVIKLIPKLRLIYIKLLPDNKVPDYLQREEQIDGHINIDNENVQKMILQFNNTISECVDKKQKARNRKLTITNNVVYRGLKKIKPLRKIVTKMKNKGKYNILLNENKRIIEANNELSKEINFLKEENKKNKELLSNLENKVTKELIPNLENKVTQELIPNLENKVTKELIPNLDNKITKELIPNLDNKINNIADEKTNVDKDLYKLQSFLEYKLYLKDKYTNLYLYRDYINRSKKKKNFNPLVSIIIPTYNGKDYLRDAIDSAINQSYKNIEIIIVNDGSKDDGATKKIVDSYKNKVKYYEKENGGVSSALNYGIEKMNGDYFVWLSHDDLIEKDHVEKLVEFVSIEGNEKTIPYSSIKIINGNREYQQNKTIGLQLNVADFKKSIIHNYYSLLEGEINGGSVLIPKEALKKYKFSENQRITQERDMWSRLIKEYKFVNIPYATSIIREHSKQVSQVNPKIKEESDEKNLNIIKGLSEEDVLGLEYSYDEFYQRLEKHYEMNNNIYMVDKIKGLNEVGREKDER